MNASSMMGFCRLPEIGYISEQAVETGELWARVTRRQVCRIAITDGANEIRFYRWRICKEGRINSIIVKCGHRPGVEPQRPQGEDQIAPLKRSIPECGNTPR